MTRFLFPFLWIGVIRPTFSSYGKYPCSMHKLKICARASLMIPFTFSRTADEIENAEPDSLNLLYIFQFHYLR